MGEQREPTVQIIGGTTAALAAKHRDDHHQFRASGYHSIYHQPHGVSQCRPTNPNGEDSDTMEVGFTELQRFALCLTQALIGVVSHNFRLVSLTRQGQGLTVKILLATHCEEDIEEIDDLRSDFEALLPRPVKIDVEVVVSGEPIILQPPSDSTIVVFKRRE